MKNTKSERIEALEQLRSMLKPGDNIYTVLRHVSKSGMSRSIDLYYMKDNTPVYITGYAAIVLEGTIDKTNRGLKTTGVGMDMGFDMVYNLSYNLYPDGFDLPEGRHGRNGDTSGFDHDGGYALVQRWL